MPSTDRCRRRVRSRGGRRSICAMTRPSTDPGSSSTEPPDSITAWSMAFRNRGPPPERLTSRSTACEVSGASSVARWINSTDASGASGPSSSVRRCGSGTAPSDTSGSRRAITRIRGTSSIRAAIARVRSAEASSSHWASSITATLGPSPSSTKRSPTADSRRSRRKRSSRAATSGVSGISRSSGTANSGSQGRSSGQAAATRSRRATTVSSWPASTGSPRSARRSTRNGKYGVDAS